MAKFEEGKFLVLNMKDVKKLSTRGMMMLGDICNEIKEMRRAEGRELNPLYHVCNRDEPYAEKVLATILLGEDVKEKNASAGRRKGMM